MNVLDSELVVAALRKAGYELTESPAKADTVLFNTCSVRQHAEDKIYSALGRLKHAKEKNPQKIIGVLGCMAQKDQQLILERAPYVDLIVGPGQLHQVPQLLEEIAAGSGPRLEVSLDRKAGNREEIQRSFESYDPDRDPQMRPSPYQAFVRIQIGCDKFCTYCIVPRVRGPEQGRHPKHIVAEAKKLAVEGCREITLLGQTVNSYRHVEGETTTHLSDLLYQLHDIAGLSRLKFVTNFPKDMTDDLLTAVRDLPKCCPYFHVPAQSGSNDVLKRMKRGYTVEEYWEMLDRLRATVPEASVTSDFIVGFCGETEEDFQQTVALVREARFKNSFIFKYSQRPGTKAPELWPDDVPEETKRRRNNELLTVQNSISEEDHRQLIGRTVEVLVEGPSKHAQKFDRDEKSNETNAVANLPHDEAIQDNRHLAEVPGQPTQLVGRTMCDRIVVFEGNRRLIGQTLSVMVYDCTPMTLFGAAITHEVGPEVYSLSPSM
jgi:tRNA-2-methylthio-N6-dimethylallyladenosine synthase